MKHHLFLILFLLAFSNLNGQNIEFAPSPVYVDDISASDFEGIGHSLVTNTATVQRTFRWDKIVVEATEGWWVSVCSPVQCYAPSVATESFTLNGGGDGTMDVHAHPNMIEGSACVEVVITDMADENLNVSNMYFFNKTPNNTSDLTGVSVKVYPNPSRGLFTIEGELQIDRVEVFNLAGQRIESFQHNDGKWYDISNMPRGTYIVRLIDRDAQTLTTKLINKL